LVFVRFVSLCPMDVRRQSPPLHSSSVVRLSSCRFVLRPCPVPVLCPWCPVLLRSFVVSACFAVSVLSCRCVLFRFVRSFVLSACVRFVLGPYSFLSFVAAPCAVLFSCVLRPSLQVFVCRLSSSSLLSIGALFNAFALRSVFCDRRVVLFSSVAMHHSRTSLHFIQGLHSRWI